MLHDVLPPAEVRGTPDSDFSRRVCENQRNLIRNMRTSYDFIVCGSGSSGSVTARRLAENPNVSVLLLEAGGSDEAENVTNAVHWQANLGTDRDWCFRAEPNPFLNGRAIPMNMGRVLGGGSSINAMIWARGHRNDWDYFAREARDPAWSYQAVLDIYRRIEDWRGPEDGSRRGVGGPASVQPAPEPNPIAPALVEAARSCGIPTFDSQNGRLMESEGGCSLMDIRVQAGRRLSIFRSYVRPFMDRSNLTVLTDAEVSRLTITGRRVTGVEVVRDGVASWIGAGCEVVLSMGAINTPRVLMHSGIGDRAELARIGIETLAHLPGVGKNFQDHIGVAGCLWEAPQALAPRNNGAEATLFWKSDPSLDTPDIQVLQAEGPMTTPETAARCEIPATSWLLFPYLARPLSVGHLALVSGNPHDPLAIHANTFGRAEDLEALVKGVDLCRQLGNSAAFAPFAAREVLPGPLDRVEMADFVRDGAVTVWHQAGTAKMGTDDLSVVDGTLRVHGLDGLRIADASIMPRVTTGNTMAPCVVIGERAHESIALHHGL